MEPKYPGLVERYVNLGDCYDRAGLQPLRQELMGCMKGYKACYQRAYRCLTAAAQIGEDLRSLLLTPALEAKMAKRARGILSREVKKGDGEAGRAVQRFLGGVTWKGVLCQFETVDALCKRVYELADTYGLAHSMLTHLAAGALASGHDVIVCPSPLFPDRMEHLLIPSLSLAFVSASPSLPYPKRPYRRIRLDAMADAELLRRNKTDDYSLALKFSDEGVQVQVTDETFAPYFEGMPQAGYTPAFVEENELKVTVPDLDDKAVRLALKSHPMWKEFDGRCISCGACTVACSTCTCFTTRDVIYGDNPEVGERRRVTASCQIAGFDQMAGQREFRSTAGERMRYKVLHKFRDYKARFGEGHMCVGCGRCTHRCPELISISATVNKVNAAVNEIKAGLAQQ